MAAEMARAMFSEMRTDQMKKQADFRKPGSGDAPMAEASKTATVYSPDFKDYFKGMPVDLCFYEILTKHGLLASAATDLPVEAASGSVVSGPATSNNSATTQQASKAGNRRGTDFDFAALTESPDSWQSGKRALDATAETNPVEARQRSPVFFLKSPKGSRNPGDARGGGLAKGNEKVKSKKHLEKLKRVRDDAMADPGSESNSESERGSEGE